VLGTIEAGEFCSWLFSSNRVADLIQDGCFHQNETFSRA